MDRTPPPLLFRLDNLRDPRVAAFLEEHLADMRRVSPPESVHALDLDGLRQPDIRFWSAWTGGGSRALSTFLHGVDDAPSRSDAIHSICPVRTVWR